MISGAGESSAETEKCVPIKLSRRHTEIIIMLGDDLTDREVAARLGISYRTVRAHLEYLFLRYNIHSKTALVARYYRSYLNGRTVEPTLRFDPSTSHGGDARAGT